MERKRQGRKTTTAAALLAAVLVAPLARADSPVAPSDAGAQAPVRVAPYLLLEVEGMTCAGCASSVRKALVGVEGVDSAQASADLGAACVGQDAPVDRSALGKALTGAGYVLVGVEPVDACPKGLAGELADAWAQRGEGLDVVTISQGEEVDLEAHLVAGKFTIVDFGAPWCGPCHDVAERLAGYLGDHGDVAVRAVNLAGQSPTASYAHPVVAQHLAYVKGVPWFLVHAPTGRVIYRGMDVERVVAVIDRHRSKSRGRSK